MAFLKIHSILWRRSAGPHQRKRNECGEPIKDQSNFQIKKWSLAFDCLYRGKKRQGLCSYRSCCRNDRWLFLQHGRGKRRCDPLHASPLCYGARGLPVLLELPSIRGFTKTGSRDFQPHLCTRGHTDPAGLPDVKSINPCAWLLLEMISFSSGKIVPTTSEFVPVCRQE